jgi:tRNA dimethylallyltransferase
LGRTARGAVGYREILEALSGRIEMDDAFATISSRTKRLARKQRTWFQRDPRIRWIPWIADPEQRARRVLEVLS